MHVVCKASDSHGQIEASLKTWWKWIQNILYATRLPMKWFLSACISMLKFIKIDWVVAHSVYSRLFVLFFFFWTYILLWIMRMYFICVYIYMSPYVYMWKGMHTQVTYIHHNLAFSLTHGLSHYHFLLLFSLRIPSFAKCSEDRISSYSTCRARGWFSWNYVTFGSWWQRH